MASPASRPSGMLTEFSALTTGLPRPLAPMRAALPTIMAGLTQCIMLCLSMVVIAALIGANGLGKPVVRALNSVNIPLGLEAGLAIVILAIILDRMSRVQVGGTR